MLTIADKQFSSRLLLGTAQYPSPEILLKSIRASETQIITVSLRRENFSVKNQFWDYIKTSGCQFLPNTAGCYSAQEAITTAQMAKEIFKTNLIKLEVIGDEQTLQPNPFELVKAAEKLLHLGFEVLPYCTDDYILCKQLVAIGCRVLMPWAAPIGSGKGILYPEKLSFLRDKFSDITLIVDAGIGKPSDAAKAMELGYDAVLLNSAVANACDPVSMATAFKLAIEAGETGYKSGLIPEIDFAKTSTPTIGQPFIDENPS